MALIENEGVDGDQLMEASIRANIRSSAKQLREESPLLKNYLKQNKLVIVGAEYSLSTGEVDFFDFSA